MTYPTGVFVKFHILSMMSLDFQTPASAGCPDNWQELYKMTNMELCRPAVSDVLQWWVWGFLDCVLTEDERWVQYVSPESKYDSMTWKHPKGPVWKKKFKTVKCHDVSLLWSCHSFGGIILSTWGHNHCRALMCNNGLTESGNSIAAFVPYSLDTSTTPTLSPNLTQSIVRASQESSFWMALYITRITSARCLDDFRGVGNVVKCWEKWLNKYGVYVVN